MHKGKTWFDKDVKKGIIRRNFAFNRYNRYCTPPNKTKYTKMRNRVGELLRSNKREYFNDRRTRFLNSPIRFSNELIRHTDSQKKNGKLHDFCRTDLFNEKFVSVSKTLAASIPTVPFTTEGLTNNGKSLFFYPTDSLEISKNVANLRNHKAAVLDGLTAEISKVSFVVICDRLTYLVNESLSSGFFPTILKAAKVVPIFKYGKKSNCEKYRPIQILSVLSKVFERVIFERLYNFVQVNNLF